MDTSIDSASSAELEEDLGAETPAPPRMMPKAEVEAAEDALQARVAICLRDRRQHLGVSQRLVGATLGMTSAGYARIEQARSRVSMWQLGQLCRMLGLSADDLLGLTEEAMAAAEVVPSEIERQVVRLISKFRRMQPDDRREILRVARILIRDAPAPQQLAG